MKANQISSRFFIAIQTNRLGEITVKKKLKPSAKIGMF